MEIITTVRDFPEKIKYHRISPDTYIRVIIDKDETNVGSQGIITHEKQRQILNLMPKDYMEGASKELTSIIANSHVNTITPEL